MTEVDRGTRSELAQLLEDRVRNERGYEGMIDFGPDSPLVEFDTSDGTPTARTADVFFGPEASVSLGEEVTGQTEGILEETPVRIVGEADPSALAEFPSLDSERTFVSRQNDRISVTVYNEGRTRPDPEYPTLEFDAGTGRLDEFVGALRDADAETVSSALSDRTRDEDLIDEAAARDERRAIREAGRDALPEIVDNPEEYDIGASDGRLILQDADTGRTESVDVSGPGDVGTAIDAAAGELAPEAEGPGGRPAAGPSGDSLTGAAAAVVLAIVGIALAWVGGN